MALNSRITLVICTLVICAILSLPGSHSSSLIETNKSSYIEAGPAFPSNTTWGLLAWGFDGKLKFEK
jgi:hypothetical protein